MRNELKLYALICLIMIGCQAENEGSESSGDSADAVSSIDEDVVDNLDRDLPVYSGAPDITATAGSSKEVKPVTINDVLDDCGIQDLSDLTRETFSTVMHHKFTRVINAGVAQTYVPLTSILDLRGTLGRTTLDVGVEVDYDAIYADSELGEVVDTTSIKARAEELANKFRGPATAVAAPLNSIFKGDWKGVLCTIIAADELENERDGAFTRSTFSPAFAPNISPIATADRYIDELGDYKVFRNITATIQETNHPDLKGVTELVGNVIVERIPAVKQTQYGEVRGDNAYRITYRFGTNAQTLALGFHLWTEFYLDHANKNYSAVIANVGDVEIMHFLKSGRGE